MNTKIEERKFQGYVGEESFSIVLPKTYAVYLGIAKGDFVKVRQEENKIVIEKAQNETDKVSRQIVDMPTLVQEIHDYLVGKPGTRNYSQ